MSKVTKITLALFALALLPGLVTAQPERPVRERGERAVRAQGEGPGRAWWKNERVQNQLGLTEKQVAAIDEKMAKVEEGAREIAPELRTANQELNELFTKDEINAQAIHKKAAQRGKLLAKMAKINLDRRLAVAGVLDPKQREEAMRFLERPALAREQRRAQRPQAESESETPRRQRVQAREGQRGAAARGAGMGEWWKRERVRKALELTEDQVKAITDKTVEIDRQAKEIRPQLAEARTAVADLFKADKINPKEIRKAGGEAAKLDLQIDKLNIERRIVIARTLKPEQRKQLAQIMGNMAQERQQVRTRLQKRDAKATTQSGDKVRRKAPKEAGKGNSRSSEK